MSENNPFNAYNQNIGTPQKDNVFNCPSFDNENMNTNDNNNAGIDSSNEILDESQNLNDLNKNSAFYDEKKIYELDYFIYNEEKARETAKTFYAFSFDKENEKSEKTTKYGTSEENKSKVEIKESTKDLNIENQNIKKERNSNEEAKINKVNSKCKFTVLKIKRYSSEELPFKIGNNLQIKSLRKDNMKIKVIRNSIQDIFPNWVGNIKTEKKDKLNRDDLIFNHKKHLNKKLSEIYNGQIDLNEKDKVIDVKLEFTLKEAFLYFAKKEMRKSILSSVLSRLKMDLNNFKEDDFFLEFDKQIYIEQKSENYKESEQYNKAFSSIIGEISSSNA